MLKGKKILIGVTGGIAAYKTAFLIRLLVKSGAEVRVVFTPSAHQFVTPLTFATLSKNPVLTEFTDNTRGEWNSHVDLGMWGDLMVIAPASANTMAKMAEGRSDNLLTAVYLSARCPVLIAPAMDLDMYKHKATKANLSRLSKNGVRIIPPGTGELASGLSGEGRMAEPEEILAYIEATLEDAHRLDGKKILVTAGPTYEAIDPVRFIGNHSSGKMGFAIAETLAERGADVTLITGPVSVSADHPKIRRVDVVSAKQMLDACKKEFPKMNAGIFAAAVADYRPAKSSPKKIKKEDKLHGIELVENADIIAAISAGRKKGQVIAGFALETDNAVANAKKKLKKKGLDFIVLNTPDKKSGFGTDTNKITIIDASGKTFNFELKPKKDVALDIVKHLESKLTQ